MIGLSETTSDLLSNLGLSEEYSSQSLELLEKGNSRYTKDLRINLKNVLASEYISEKEAALLGVSIATNERNEVLKSFFVNLSKEKEATDAEIAEAVACASLLASNNVFYRFRHFVGKEKYNQIPGKIKMNIMMRPETGKEFFELMSIAISAVNGCEMCVKSHEESLINLGATEERIFDAIRLASVIRSVSLIIN